MRKIPLTLRRFSTTLVLVYIIDDLVKSETDGVDGTDAIGNRCVISIEDVGLVAD